MFGLNQTIKRVTKGSKTQGVEFLRAHPITIAANLWRFSYLIVIPLVRGIVAALQGGFARWLRGAWMDVLVVLLMVGLSTLQWWSVTYQYDKRQVRIASGLVVRKLVQLPISNIVTLSLVNSFYLRPFGAVRLRVDTLGGSRRDADLTILLHKNVAQQAMNRHQGHGDSLAGIYRPGTSAVLALALLTSNSLGGIVFLSALISQSGRFLGEGFSQRLVTTFEHTARNLAFGIPPAAAAIAYALIFGWLVGFVLTLLRYKDFSVRRCGRRLQVAGGMFTRQEYALPTSQINFIDIRQSLTSKALKLYSLYISVVGYDKYKHDISCLIPTEDLQDFRSNLELLLPELRPVGREIKPPKGGVFRFLGDPLIWCGVVPASAGMVRLLLPSWGPFILFVALMGMAPPVYFLIVRILDYRTGGISFDGNNYTLRYSKGLYLHTVVIPRHKIVRIEQRQGLFQRGKNRCDCAFHIVSEGSSKHLIRGLDWDETEAFLENSN